jgi:Sulfotransferase domain
VDGSLTLIGAAYPRTGTMSVKRALDILGVGRSYHMHEVWQNPHHIPIWEAAGNGTMPDWHSLLAGYAATLDTPACLFWRELLLAFPDAKVLLLRRDPESWYDSMFATVYQVMTGPEGDADPALRMARRLFLEQHMHGRFEDRDFAVATYTKCCNDVIKEIPEERLLVYEAAEGWEPLCRFLGYDVPSEPFPRKNTRDAFLKRNRMD